MRSEAGKLRRTSYTIANWAGIVLPCGFHISSPPTSSFTGYDWICKCGNSGWEEEYFIEEAS